MESKENVEDSISLDMALVIESYWVIKIEGLQLIHTRGKLFGKPTVTP
jgi:hypothetical protein